ncbi:MAG: Rqc2 family fibronectin-binding protein [Lachnospiraceae bacterium]
MAFDGITISCLKNEFEEHILGGRIQKIAQPEPDELLITIKNTQGTYRLVLSASASLPLAYLTNTNKTSPLTAPNFCMLLRKHIGNGRITKIEQPEFERILKFEIEHLDELGDLCRKYLIIELMGKHSNIIFTNDTFMIIDSIKHISQAISSLREVLPGRPYFVPSTTKKIDPFLETKENFINTITQKSMDCYKFFYTNYNGFSPQISHEICYRSGGNTDLSTQALTPNDIEYLWAHFSTILNQIKEKTYTPCILYSTGKPIEYSCLFLTSHPQEEIKKYDSISTLLETYYDEKNKYTRIRQKSIDLRKIVQISLERNVKKYDLQLRQMEDTKKRDLYKVYGELITTYGYNVLPNAKSMDALNYYTNETITIPLDPDLSAIENAKKYFEKYAKLKRTYTALLELTKQVKEEIDYLDSIQTALDIALKEEDLLEIKEELTQSGFIKRKSHVKKQKYSNKPFHYISTDGYHIYVGKNNLQNEELTFKFATGNDMWFHAKGIPGSHVILKSIGEEIPDLAYVEAGKLAAYYSKGRGSEKLEIDYIEKKHVKKPSGSKPGFVIYHTNYSLITDSDISSLTQVE